MILMDKMILMD